MRAVAALCSGAHQRRQTSAFSEGQGIDIVHAHAVRGIVYDGFSHGAFLYGREVEDARRRIVAIRPQMLAADASAC